MMTVCSSTDLFYQQPNGEFYTPRETLEIFRTAGFTALDASLWVYADRGHPLAGDGWREWIWEWKELANEMGITFLQTHGKALSGMQWDDPDYPDWDFFYRMNERCIEATRILGAPWMVMHPSNCPHDAEYHFQKAKDRSFAYLAPYIELAKRAGIGIAVENMVDLPSVPRKRYCGRDLEDLADLIDTINDPAVGICVDTGHAHLSGIRAGDLIRSVGSRLKCLHIDDNRADRDTHLPPFLGTVDWQDVANALREVGYSRAFSLELTAGRVPREAAKDYAKFVYATAKTVSELANEN